MPHIKLGDFGFAQIESEYNQDKCGTLAYIAPEIFTKKYTVSTKVDMWSVGVVLYTCLYGVMSFMTPEEAQKGIIPFEGRKISISAKTLIMSLFNLIHIIGQLHQKL